MMQKFFPLLFLSLFLTIHLSAQKTDSLISIVAVPAKMDLLYIGVDNPIRIYAGGIPYDSLDLTISNGTISKVKNDWYIARVSKRGEVSIRISSKDNKHSVTYTYGVLRIPDPVPALGAKYSRSDTLGLGLFKAQMGIVMILENFNFEAMCNTVDYNVTQIGWSAIDGKRFVKTVKNTGVRFNPEAIELINDAWPGDIFIFSDITARCPGDEKNRKLNSLIFFMDDSD